VPPFWSSTTQSAGAVDVTAAMLDPVQALIDGTVKQQWIGKGRDVAKKSGADVAEVIGGVLGLALFFCMFCFVLSHAIDQPTKSPPRQPPQYTRLHVERVERIENVDRVRMYTSVRGALAEEVRTRGPAAALPRIVLKVDEHVGVALKDDAALLDASVNEKILFHGTSTEIADVVVRTGFDARVSRPGMFSSGSTSLYFGAEASKADEYAEPDPETGLCTMILARVVVGNPFVALAPLKYPRPPCVKGHTGVCGHARFHSLLAPSTDEHPQAALTKHMEIVNFDSAVALPIYRVLYRRE
jgi:hypothetical protein